MSRLEKLWYGKSIWVLFLIPAAWIFAILVVVRRWLYQNKILQARNLDIPVIIAGNIAVGGTGKTPLVIWITNLLKQAGYSPAIVATGYKGQAQNWPQQVRPDSDPVMVGDEAVMLASRCRCPVAVGPDRVAAAEALLEYHDCNVIISDDGLQHYRLGRGIEFAVIDGIRRSGNGFCLPAGPLREPVSRLKHVDFVLVTGGGVMRNEYSMSLVATNIVNLRDESKSRPTDAFRNKTVHAVAGIGYPKRFFSHCQRLGIKIIEHPFEDHYIFTAEDIQFDDDFPVLMTEKDAVKCRRFADDNCWYLAIDAKPDKRVADRLLSMLKEIKQ